MSNREWGSVIAPEELTDLVHATDEFGKLWASIKSPPSNKAAMDGSPSDIHFLDWLRYEGFRFPPSGIGGATLITAEIVRRAAKLEWVRAHDGELYLADEDPSIIVICPRARVQEIELSRRPQCGRFTYFAIRAAIDCYGWHDEADESLRQLISELDDGEVEPLVKNLNEIHAACNRARSHCRPKAAQAPK